jgi:hypothetical protein
MPGFSRRREREMKQKVVRGSLYTAGLAIVLVLLDIPHLKQPEINLIKPTVMEAKKASWSEKAMAKQIGKAYASAGWGWSGKEWLCLHDLWMRESRWDYLAQNPRSSAFGIAQRLGETSRDPRIQILRGLRYVAHRHDTPCKALAFHNKRGHY